MKEEHLNLFVDLLVEKAEDYKEQYNFMAKQLAGARAEIEKLSHQEDHPDEGRNATVEEFKAQIQAYQDRAVELEKRILQLTEELKNKGNSENTSKIQREFDKLQDKYNEQKKKLQAKTVELNSKNVMIDYANFMGFKFARKDIMKKAMEDGAPPAEPQIVQNEKTVHTAPENLADFDDQDDRGIIDFDVIRKTKCPHGMMADDYRLRVVGHNCKECPYCEGVNMDERYVKCNHGKNE